MSIKFKSSFFSLSSSWVASSFSFRYSSSSVLLRTSHGGVLTLTWYTYMCPPFQVLFCDIWYVFIRDEEALIHELCVFWANYGKKHPIWAKLGVFLSKLVYWRMGNCVNWFLETGSACKSTYNVGKSTPSGTSESSFSISNFLHVYLVDDSCVSLSTWYQISGGVRGWWSLVISSPYACLMHGGRRLRSTSWSWGESSCKLWMTQNVHIVVVQYRTLLYSMHTKCSKMWHVKRSSKGQKTSRISVIWVDELCHPS